MCDNSIPEPLSQALSKEELNKKYDALALETQGRLDYKTEKGRESIALLQKYYQAFANLYGAIYLKNAWNVLSPTGEDCSLDISIYKEDFYAFSEVARYEDHDYFVVEEAEIFDDEKEPGGIDSRLILTKKAYLEGALYENYYLLMKEQIDHPFYTPSRQELLLWAEPDIRWRSHAAIAVKKFIETRKVSRWSNKKDINGEKIAGKALTDFVFLYNWETDINQTSMTESEKLRLEETRNAKESEKILRIIEKKFFYHNPHTDLRSDVSHIVSELRAVDVHISIFQLKQFIKIYVEFINSTRLAALRGWTPIELGIQCKKPTVTSMMLIKLFWFVILLLFRLVMVIYNLYRKIKPRESKSHA